MYALESQASFFEQIYPISLLELMQMIDGVLVSGHDGYASGGVVRLILPRFTACDLKGKEEEYISD